MNHAGHSSTTAPPSGLVGLNKPILIHSLRNPSCDLKTQTQEQCDWKFDWWRNWYTADWAYARPVVYLFCAGIGVFILGNILFHTSQSARYKRHISDLPGVRRCIALSRSLSSRQLRFGTYYSPSTGSIILVCILVTFSAAMTLGPKPYYWPSMAYGGSPPIATRTGWLSLAMLPFLITFATKWNIITLLTGVSHERLQVYHRWVAWVMYVLALIHTFPFIILNIKNGTMVAAWKTRVWYWSGVAALVPQTWLVFMSWGPIRNRFYETFKWLHYLAAAFFIPLLFIHCNFRLTSWDYFFATAALYVFSFLVRWIRTLFYNRIASANLELLPGDMVKVSISTRVKWKPGQHFFIRFFGTGIHALSAHPFTVATLPNTSDSQQNVADVYIRVRKGFTGRLGSMAKRGKLTEFGVMLDGPYGGVPGSLTSYDRVLLLGGGAGITFIVPLLLDVVRRYDEAPCKQVDVVWATRSQESLTWFKATFQSIIDQAAKTGLSVSIVIHVTDEKRSLGSDVEIDSDQKSKETSLENEKDSEKPYLIRPGRPNLPQIIQNAAMHGGTLGIAACGPESFSFDVRNAASDVQLKIAQQQVPVRELWLHTETFGW